MKKAKKHNVGVLSEKNPTKLQHRNFFTYKFILKKERLKKGTNVYPIYFQAFTGGIKREFATGLHSTSEQWDKSREEIKGDDKSSFEGNLILSNLKSKAHTIITRHYLQNKQVDWETFKEEIWADPKSENFLTYLRDKIEECENNNEISESTARTHRVILGRCQRFNAHWNFSLLSEKWFSDFEKFLQKELNLKAKKTNITLKNGGKNTIGITKKIVKTYLIKAQKDGFNFQIPPIKIKFAPTTRTYLDQDELTKLVQAYRKSHYPENSIKSVALQMFLFSCATGLRISDVKRFESSSIEDGLIKIVAHKLRKEHRQNFIPVTPIVNELLKNHNGALFRKYSEQKINDALKLIASDNEINKEVSMNVGRHTFATIFLQKSGNIKALQDILGHSSIVTTQNYLHLDKSFLKKEIESMNDLFD